jgi:hypothetical protein
MNVGKLYQFKKLCWMLYPSKEIAALVAAPCYDLGTPANAAAHAAAPIAAAAYYSTYFNCNVSYVFPNSIFCLLEKDGIYYKAITANGELGWFYLSDFYKDKDDIEEVNQ